MVELKMFGRYAFTYCYNNPSNMQLGLTNRCNFNCIWCYRKDIKKLDEVDMPKDKAINIISQFNHLKNISFTDYGETLLYPIDDLVEIINFAKTKADHITLSTNGSLVTEKFIDKIRDSQLSLLACSIDSPLHTDYKRIRKYDLSLILKNLNNFTSKTKIPLQLSAVTTSETFKSFIFFPDLCKKISASILHFQNLFETVDTYHKVENTKENKLLAAEIENVCRKLGIETDIMNIFKWQHNHCYEPFQNITINSKGYLVPCCAWETNNLVKVDFKKVWNSKKIRDMRKIIIKQKYPKHCQNICRKRYI